MNEKQAEIYQKVLDILLQIKEEDIRTFRTYKTISSSTIYLTPRKGTAWSLEIQPKGVVLYACDDTDGYRTVAAPRFLRNKFWFLNLLDKECPLYKRAKELENLAAKRKEDMELEDQVTRHKESLKDLEKFQAEQ